MISELFSLSRMSAGFIAVIVGYTSSAVIVFQAAGASTEEISSWLWALGIGMGVSSIGLSIFFRHPVLTAWSTPGAALLVTSLSGVTMSDAIGAFIFCSLLITFCGISGLFEKIMRYVPQCLASAMLAGVLLQFGLNLFLAIETKLFLVGSMLAVFILIRHVLPRYVTPITLLVGIIIAEAQGLLNFDNMVWTLAKPVFTYPSFSISTLISVGIPLFIVTMASQNMPGLATLRANGYQTPASPLISWTGLTGLVLAPFGGFAFNLAAITAAICMGKEADIDPKKRYLASMWAGVFYLITGLFGATVAGFFAAFPTELVAAIAGLALLGTIGSSLSTSLSDKLGQEAALITFLITGSGMSLMGVGSAFWRLVIGLIAYHLKQLHSA